MKDSSLCKKILISLFTLVLFCFALFVVNQKNDNSIKSISFNEEKKQFECVFRGQSRHFLLYLPQDFDSRSASERADIKLILMLHGAGESGIGFNNKTGFDKSILPRKYALLYVNSTMFKDDALHNYNWHYGDDKFSKADADFLSEITCYIQKEYGLNKKVFAVGFSNGGFMINRLAVSKSKYFTAVASVAGMMPDIVWKNRKNKCELGYLQINGTKDDVVPKKNPNENVINPNPLMEDVIAYWVKANSLPEEKQVFQLSERSVLENYRDKVMWLQIEDAVHGWTSEDFAGIDINTVILDFFDKF